MISADNIVYGDSWRKKDGHFIVSGRPTTTILLGSYASDKRCLEVLDAVQEHIHILENEHNYNQSIAGREDYAGHYDTTYPVFVMPVE